MSITIKSVLGALRMGKTSTITQLNTSSSLNLDSINTSKIILDTATTGLLHTDSNGLVSSELVDANDISNFAITSEKLADSIVLTGTPTAPTANSDTRTNQIATTAYVKTIIDELMGSASGSLDTLQELAAALQNNSDFGNTIVASIATKVSLATDEIITGIKTFNKTPILSLLTTNGIVHNDSNGNLSTDLIQTADIDDSVITTDKIVDGNITFSKLENNLATDVQYLMDTHDNKQPDLSPGFFHIASDNITFDENSNPIYTLSNNSKYILETPCGIFLPPIEEEGVIYSITNKSGAQIIVSTLSPDIKMFSCFVAPEGDDAFEVDNHRTLDVISIIVNGVTSWHARFF